MKDVDCPYCGEAQEINHDDGYGYREDEIFAQECGSCGKTFAYTTATLYHYTATYADCLNDGEHKYEPTRTWPVECTRMQCTDCGEERQPTEEEWAHIRREATVPNER